jgi:hypothetical protein
MVWVVSVDERKGRVALTAISPEQRAQIQASVAERWRWGRWPWGRRQTGAVRRSRARQPAVRSPTVRTKRPRANRGTQGSTLCKGPRRKNRRSPRRSKILQTGCGHQQATEEADFRGHEGRR